MECKGLDAKFVETACQFHSKHPHFVAGGATAFTIKHYAGDVRYNSSGFGDANREGLRGEILELCQREENDSVLKR
jgi:myosin heavy subunit